MHYSADAEKRDLWQPGQCAWTCPKATSEEVVVCVLALLCCRGSESVAENIAANTIAVCVYMRGECVEKMRIRIISQNE